MQPVAGADVPLAVGMFCSATSIPSLAMNPIASRSRRLVLVAGLVIGGSLLHAADPVLDSIEEAKKAY